MKTAMATARDLAPPAFATAAGWSAVASGLAVLGLSSCDGPDGDAALRLDYDFGSGAGFVVARREIALALPESWELRVMVRGDAPPNGFEIKLVDEAGTSVWWWTRPAFQPTAAWTELRIPSREVVFAWGPAGGGLLYRTSAVEIAVVATPGGKGRLELAGFRIFDRTPRTRLVVEASSSVPEHEAASVLGRDVATSWQSGKGPGPHSLRIDLGEEREIGGLVVHWVKGAEARSFRVEARGTEGAWTDVYDASIAGAPTSFIALPLLRARWLSLVMMAGDADCGVGIEDIDVRPVEWSRTRTEFLTNVALASPRGQWPRYLLREQVYWTPVSTPQSGALALLGADGAVEIGEAGFTLEPFLLVAGAEGPQRIAWSDVETSVRLKQASLPVATATWKRNGLCLDTMAVAEDWSGEDVVLLRWRVTNLGTARLCTTLFVAIRPLQVTPPWQAYKSLGGPSPIRSIDWDGHAAVVNDAVRVRPISACRGFGGAAFDEGGVAASLLNGELPERKALADEAGGAEGVFAFDLDIAPGASSEVFVESSMPARWHLGVPTTQERPSSAAALSAVGLAAPVENRRDGGARIEAALKNWAHALPTSAVSGAAGAVANAQCAVTAIGHILCCRDGAALQPGPRRYARSWIRDGAIMSAALVRAGLPETAIRFITWYADHQRADGFVPCCIDRSGVDPLVEHDSHGQLIYTVAEIYRFTRDLSFVRGLWSRCAMAAGYLESIRSTRCTADYEAGQLHACFGLLPESVSHEGYLAQPVHAYWDDFWGLRGLRDAAFLAGELGLADKRKHWDDIASQLDEAIRRSIVMVMEERKLETVPASVEWADFDPTAIAGAISLTGAAHLFPRDALERTFDEYLRGFRARRDGTVPRANYAPYEVRIVGALVAMGRREDANELMDSLLGDRRPLAWNQWPEIAWKDPAAPAHLGDLPHCWIGAEYAIALRMMLVYERESDGALVVGAGLRDEWIDEGIQARGIATWYGNLNLEVSRTATGVCITVCGDADPPGGFVSGLPGAVEIVRAKD
jgi:hypothetical protein